MRSDSPSWDTRGRLALLRLRATRRATLRTAANARCARRSERPRTPATWPSELIEVAVDLPVRDLRAVLVPFGALRLDEVRQHVVAQRLDDDRISLELVDRVAERARQLP